MSPRFFSLLVCVVGLGCGPATPSGSSGSSSSGEAQLPPPPKVVWTAMSTTDAPSARYAHTAVWTGSKMIVWGGNTSATPSVTNTGGVYDPATDTWKPTSLTNAPAARHAHVAVWTGSKMIVWGGFGSSALETTGGIYDPETDTWSAMSTMNQPPPRTHTTAIWTGKKFVVWGGLSGTNALATGGMYDPATDKWETVNQAGAPAPRLSHAVAWSGSVMMFWGGTNLADWLNSGALFDPEGTSTGVWTTSTNSTGAPPPREKPAVGFVNDVFVAWGGWNGGPTVDSGGMLDPTKNEWIATTSEGAPTARVNHVGVVAGQHLLVWGGCGESLCTAAELASDGGQFVPSSTGGTWYPIETQDALAARYSPTAVYTGDGVIIWGGRLDPQTRTNTGAFAAF